MTRREPAFSLSHAKALLGIAAALRPHIDPLGKQNVCCMPDPVGVDGQTVASAGRESVDSGFEVY
jgi:hypothetical protein